MSDHWECDGLIFDAWETGYVDVEFALSEHDKHPGLNLREVKELRQWLSDWIERTESREKG